MLALRLISFLLATRLSCVSALSGDEAKQRFAFLQGKALTLTTEANALSTISCLPSLPTFPPNPYDVRQKPRAHSPPRLHACIM